MPETRKLRVLANPYHYVDHEGRPAAAVPYAGSADLFIGATVDMEASAAADKRVYVFTGETVELTYSAHYRRRLEEGELLPADAETAKLSGLGAKALHGQAALDAARDAAATAQRGAYGADAEVSEPETKTLAQRRAEAAAEAAKSQKPAGDERGTKESA